jgi:hypothetical protein
MTKIPKTTLEQRLWTKRGRPTCQRIIDISVEGQPPFISGGTISTADSACRRGRSDGGMGLFPFSSTKPHRETPERIIVNAKVPDYEILSKSH